MARVEAEATGCREEGTRTTLTRKEALEFIGRELQSWGYSMTRLPRYLTLEQALKIVGAT